MSSRFISLTVLMAVPLFAPRAHGQGAEDRAPRIGGRQSSPWFDQRGIPYRARPVSPVQFQDSSRIESLMRAGQIYLSLQDAIALALENNLDIELQRYGPALAGTDMLRANGGGTLRGLPLTVSETPAGVGGPASPLLASAGAGYVPSSSVPVNVSTSTTAQAQVNLSITGSTPFSTGPTLPAFDPALVARWNVAHQSTPQANPLVTGSNLLVGRTALGSLGVQQGFSPGTLVGANFDSASQDTNAARNSFNPYTSSALGITITQPLLRGFGAGLNRRFIRIAKNNERLADLVFRQQVINTVSGVIRLYYDLVSLYEDVRVKQQTLALAQKLYEDNKAQVDQGTLAPIELVRAQAQVAAGRQDLANSEGYAREQELIMKNVITRRGTADEMIRAAHIVPTDSIPAPDSEPVQPVQDLLATAYRNRPDFAGAGLQLENSEINLAGSRNQLLPEIDLVGTFQNSGLAGQLNPLALPVPTGTPLAAAPNPFIGGFGSTLAQIFRRNYPTYGVGLFVNLPLRNRVAQADLVRDELQVRQAQVRRQQLENQVRLEVEDALIGLERTRTAYDAAVQARVLQEQSLQAEQEKYEVGLSTTLLIIQYQSLLAQARSTEVAARGAYAKARTALERAIGMTLENHGVSVEEALHGHVSRPPSAVPATVPGLAPPRP